MTKGDGENLRNGASKRNFVSDHSCEREATEIENKDKFKRRKLFAGATANDPNHQDQEQIAKSGAKNCEDCEHSISGFHVPRCRVIVAAYLFEYSKQG
jgi:hypothetical protein